MPRASADTYRAADRSATRCLTGQTQRYVRMPGGLEARVHRHPLDAVPGSPTASRVTSATSGGRVPSTTRTRSPDGGSGASSRIGPAKTFCALPFGAVGVQA